MANHRSKISSWVAFVYKNTNRIYHGGSGASLWLPEAVLYAGPAVSYTIREVWGEEPYGNTSCLSWTHLRGNRYHKQHMVGITHSSPLAVSMGIRGRKDLLEWNRSSPSLQTGGEKFSYCVNIRHMVTSPLLGHPVRSSKTSFRLTISEKQRHNIQNWQMTNTNNIK